MAEFFWNAKKTPEHLNVMLRCFAEAYPAVFHETEGKRELILKKGAVGQLTVSIGKRQCTVEAGSQAAFARGIGSVMAGCPVRESTPFQTLGIMLDCSRNKVFRIDFLKQYLTRLALMGYNMAMLYTEDTYQLPGEPLFGYMRGAYSLEEIQELDAFAKRLADRRIGFDITDAAKSALADEGYDPVYGARPLRRVITRRLENPVSRMIIAGELPEGSKLHVDYDGEFRLSRA